MMARLNKEQVIGMLFDEDFDSGGESEIEEDLAFPLPMAEETGYTPSRFRQRVQQSIVMKTGIKQRINWKI